MANFAGHIGPPHLGLDSPAGLAPSAAPFVHLYVQPSAPILFGPLALVVGAVAASAFAGTVHEVHGGELFEKIIVTPRKKALGFVLSANTFTVDVWNTFKAALKTMTAINITGGGGLSITNPFGLPQVYGPFQSRSFDALVPQDGDATVLNTAVFFFAGVLGTDLVVTGTRITVISPDPDWGEGDEGIGEATEYLTEILRSYGDTEQRYSLRKTPRTRVTFRIVTVAVRDTAALEALLWGWQSRLYGVPFWPDAQPLLADCNVGATSISVDTTGGRKFAAGGLVVLWRDMHNYEALAVQGVSPGSITTTSPITIPGWVADGRTFVIPVLKGRLGDNAVVRALSALHAELDGDFECEVV